MCCQTQDFEILALHIELTARSLEESGDHRKKKKPSAEALGLVIDKAT